jgi:hypothetical protein
LIDLRLRLFQIQTRAGGYEFLRELRRCAMTLRARVSTTTIREAHPSRYLFRRDRCDSLRQRAIVRGFHLIGNAPPLQWGWSGALLLPDRDRIAGVTKNENAVSNLGTSNTHAGASTHVLRKKILALCDTRRTCDAQSTPAILVHRAAIGIGLTGTLIDKRRSGGRLLSDWHESA